MVKQRSVYLWAAGKKGKGGWREKQDNSAPDVNKRLNIFICFLKNLVDFIPRTCFLQGFTLNPTGCFKEFSCFVFGCTMRRLLPDA